MSDFISIKMFLDMGGELKIGDWIAKKEGAFYITSRISVPSERYIHVRATNACRLIVRKCQEESREEVFNESV